MSLLKKRLLLAVVWNVSRIICYLTKGRDLELLMVCCKLRVLVLVRWESTFTSDWSWIEHRRVFGQLGFLPRRVEFCHGRARLWSKRHGMTVLVLRHWIQERFNGSHRMRRVGEELAQRMTEKFVQLECY